MHFPVVGLKWIPQPPTQRGGCLLLLHQNGRQIEQNTYYYLLLSHVPCCSCVPVGFTSCCGCRGAWRGRCTACRCSATTAWTARSPSPWRSGNTTLVCWWSMALRECCIHLVVSFALCKLVQPLDCVRKMYPSWLSLFTNSRQLIGFLMCISQCVVQSLLMIVITIITFLPRNQTPGL